MSDCTAWVNVSHKLSWKNIVGGRHLQCHLADISNSFLVVWSSMPIKRFTNAVSLICNLVRDKNILLNVCPCYNSVESSDKKAWYGLYSLRWADEKALCKETKGRQLDGKLYCWQITIKYLGKSYCWMQFGITTVVCHFWATWFSLFERAAVPELLLLNCNVRCSQPLLQRHEK